MGGKITNDLFGVIHLVGIAALVAMLFKSRFRESFEQRCVGKANAIDLAWIRIVACACLLIYITTEDLTSLSQFDSKWYDWPGYLIHLKRGVLRFFVENESHLALLTGALVVTLILGLFGIGTRFVIPVATILYILYAALLRSFGKYFHDGYLVMYVMMVLSFVPCGDAWSLDSRWRTWRRKQTGQPYAPKAAAYNWMVWACFAALCLPYLQLATSKIVAGGLWWFDGRSLRNYMITDCLNLTEWNIDLGSRAHRVPTFLWTIAGFFALATEAIYAFVLVSQRLRRFVPYCIALLHLGVWFGQDALFVDAILMPLAFLVPSRWFPSAVIASAPVTNTPLDKVRAWLRGAGIPIVLVAIMLFFNHATYRNLFRYKWPLEGWQMYAGKTNLDAAVHYRRFLAHYPDGHAEQTGLEECAAFLEKPYRLDLGLARNLPEFLQICLLRTRDAVGLTYETRTWHYKKRSHDEHLADPPDYAFRVEVVAGPPHELARQKAGEQLLKNATFESHDPATAIPPFWIMGAGAFLGFGVDPATGNHVFLVAAVPVGAGKPAAAPQAVRQLVELPVATGERTVTASVLARTRTPGGELAIELDGAPRVFRSLPADGAWHRIELSAPVPGPNTKATISLVAAGDTYFDDATLTMRVDPASVAPPAE